MKDAEAQLWRELDDELSKWRLQELTPRFFLRDDDATQDTPQLQKLLTVCERFEVPLLLATIPEPAQIELANLLESNPLITPAVHGYRHKDYSGFGEKTCELGTHRPLETVLDELRVGREKLLDMFNGRLSSILVPPWNRIAPEVLARTREPGFKAVSAHGWLKARPPVRMVNVHLDIIHWSGGRKGRELDWVQSELLRHLGIARHKGGRAIGLLTHHLAHDEQAWRVLDQLLGWSRQNGIVFVEADSLLNEPEESIADQP